MHPLGWQYEQYPEVRKVLDQGQARIATAEEYSDWLEGHLWNRWGSLDFEFPNSDAKSQSIYIVTKDIDLPPLNGALAMKIIAAEGVTVNMPNGPGDNEVFRMDDYSATMNKNHKLKIYNDVLDALTPRGYFAESFIYAERRPTADFNKAVMRPNLVRAAVDTAHKGLSEDVSVRPLQLKPKAPAS